MAKPFQNGEFTAKREFAPQGEQILSLRETSCEMGDSFFLIGITSPESILIHLKEDQVYLFIY